MNRKHRSFLASLLLLALFGVFAGCRETPINNNPVPRGRQFVGEINGVVRDGNTGAPLSGVTVRLIGAEGQPGGETVTATTNADGIYIFRNLQAGFYKIAATPPAGYAPTRVADVELRDDANATSTGVAVVRIARDIRFFTANAGIQGRLSIRTPDGRTLPAPAGTPVFIDFTIPGGVNPGNPNERTRTVGDVQVATVQATVRTDTTIGGRTVNIIVSGLPAVGSLASAGEFPTLVVPNFEVGGVVYGDPNTGRAAQVPLRGLRPGTISLIDPAQLEIQPQLGPTRLLATSNAPGGVSASAFGTTDTITIIFNKPMQPATVRATITRTRTPYNTLGTAILSGVTTTPLPAGTYLGVPCVANQAYRVTLNRPFVTGSEHEIDFDGTPTAVDGSTYVSGTSDKSLRTFTTRTGLRVLSVTIGGVAVAGGVTTFGIPTSGTVSMTFAVPSGATIRPVVLRGTNRTLELQDRDNADVAVGIDVPVVPGTVTGPAIDRDTATVTGGNTLTFGYSGLLTNRRYQLIPRNAAVSDPTSDETPRIAAAGFIRGFISSTLPGDFGVEQASNVTLDPNSELNLRREFRTVVPGEVPPIQILSFPRGTSVPTDTVIRIRFSRPLTVGTAVTNQLRPVDLAPTSFTQANLQSNRIRIWRRGPAPPAIPIADPSPTSLVIAQSPNESDFGFGTSGVGRGIPNEFLGYRATLEEGGTVLAIRRLERPFFLGGQTIPFESGTTYTVDLAIPGLATGVGTGTIPGTTGVPGQFVRFSFRTVRGIEATGLRVEPLVPESPGDSGRIVITFSRPLAPNVVFRTNGPGANCALIASPTSAPSVTDLDATRRDANAGLPPFAATNAYSQRRVKTYIDGTDSTRIDSVGTISADRLSVSFRYFYLPNGNHRFIAFPPAVDNGIYEVPDAFARDISRSDTATALNIEDYPSAIRSELPGDYGLAGPASFYRNRIDFAVNITPPPPPVARPVFVVSTSVTPANQLNYTDTLVSITFSRSMNKASFTAYQVEQLTNTLGDQTALNITSDIDTLWNDDATTVRILRKPYSSTDTVKPFLAGAVYRITLGAPTATDGGTLRGFTGLAFRMQPRTRITGAVVTGGRLGTATRNLITGTNNYAVADTVGEIRLIFSRPPFGNYHTRGSASNAREIRFGLRDTADRQSGAFDDGPNALLAGNDIGGFFATQNSGEVDVNNDLSATIDCVGTINGNELRFKYYVSRHLLHRRNLLVGNGDVIGAGSPIERTGPTNFVVQLIPTATGPVPADSSAPLIIRTSGQQNTPASTTDPRSIRSNIRGDLGVLRLDANLNSKFSGIGDRGIRFDIKFGITSEGGLTVPTSSSIPDMIVSAVRNATETVTEVAQKTASTVRSWWKRFRGE